MAKTLYDIKDKIKTLLLDIASLEKKEKNITNTPWNSMCTLLEEYVKEFGKLPTQRTFYKDKNIGNWINKQKKNYKDNTLSQDRIDRLMTIDESILGNKYEIQWNSMCTLLEEYVKEFNQLPKTNVIYKDEPIGKWLSKQRQNYKDDILSQNRIDRLTAINRTILIKFLRIKDNEIIETKCHKCGNSFTDTFYNIKKRSKQCKSCFYKRLSAIAQNKRESLHLEPKVEIFCKKCGSLFQVPLSRENIIKLCPICKQKRSSALTKKQKEKNKFYKDLAVINRELSVINIRVYGQGRYENINYLGDIDKPKKRKSKESISKKLIGSTIKYYLKESNEEYQGMVTDLNEEENQICFDACLWLNIDDVFISKDILK